MYNLCWLIHNQFIKDILGSDPLDLSLHKKCLLLAQNSIQNWMLIAAYKSLAICGTFSLKGSVREYTCQLGSDQSLASVHSME